MEALNRSELVSVVNEVGGTVKDMFENGTLDFMPFSQKDFALISWAKTKKNYTFAQVQNDTLFVGYEIDYKSSNVKRLKDTLTELNSTLTVKEEYPFFVTTNLN